MTQEAVQSAADEGASRPYIEPYTLSFVVKIWLEETPTETNHPTWRGHITHVATGQRCYFDTLGGILAFIAPYLAELQVKLPVWQRLRLWLNR
jgi:hypothetical protein